MLILIQDCGTKDRELALMISFSDSYNYVIDGIDSNILVKW
jgi:hypothetical protein